jgi:hypothetical protein
MNVAYWEEAESTDSELLLGQDGNVYQIGGFGDNGAVIHGALHTPTVNAGNARASKLFGDEWLDIDPSGLTTIRQSAQFDFGAVAPPLAFIGVGLTGRQSLPVDVNGGLGQLAQNARMNLTWGSATSSPSIFEWQAWYSQKSEASLLRNTDWNDAGYAGTKWIQGMILRCDTFDVERTVQIQGDGGAVGATILVRHAGEREKPYSFPQPFAAHLLRLAPVDAGEWLLYSHRFVYAELPESTEYWVTQRMSFGAKGWLHLRDGYLALWGDTNGTATMVIAVDGVPLPPFPFSFVTGLQKIRFDAPPNKGLVYEFSVVSPQKVRIFEKDLEVRIRQWGSPSAYSVVRPLGDVAQETGAKI